MMNQKNFEREKCCMFFGTWMETAESLCEDFGKEMKCDFYDAILRYSLYGEEPQLNSVIKYIWPTIKEQIEKSIEHRSRGFKNEETTQKVIDYKNEHPEATQRAIADACGCSLGKVNKTLNSTTVTQKEPEKELEKDITSNLDETTIHSIAKDYKEKKPYKEIQTKYSLTFPVNKENMEKIVKKSEDIKHKKQTDAVYAYAEAHGLLDSEPDTTWYEATEYDYKIAEKQKILAERNAEYY